MVLSFFSGKGGLPWPSCPAMVWSEELICKRQRYVDEFWMEGRKDGNPKRMKIERIVGATDLILTRSMLIEAHFRNWTGAMG